MTTNTLTLSARLAGAWTPGAPTMIQNYMPPFYDDLDFDSYRMMGQEKAARVHVTFPDHYALLTEILRTVTEETNNTPKEILINSRMPSVVRIPQVFFDENVMFLSAPMTEAERMAARGTEVLVIEEHFARHTIERADNSLTLVWYNAPHHGATALAKISARLHALGISTDLQVAA